MSVNTRFDTHFVDEIAALEDGKDIRTCLQCGICSSSCPVREEVPSFSPRQLIAKMLLGLKEEVLSAEEIWYCARCQYCTANCRKNIRPGDIITAARTIALREGYRSSAGARHTLAFLHDLRREGALNELLLPLRTLGLVRTIRLIPYGIRLLLRGKVPPPVPRSIDGMAEIRALVDEFDD